MSAEFQRWFADQEPRWEQARQSAKQREAFARVRLAERQYQMQLRRVAKHIADLVKGFQLSGAEKLTEVDQAKVRDMMRTLERYSGILKPWATAVSARMLQDVQNRDLQAWRRLTEGISKGLYREIYKTPVGELMRRLISEQVMYIQNIPLETAQWIGKQATQNVYHGMRYAELSEKLQRMDFPQARADLIARTETARAGSLLTMARSIHIGAEGYIWRNVHDARVRPRHWELDGTFHVFDKPPIASEPGQKIMRYHPGCGPNCRCFMEIVFPRSVGSNRNWVNKRAELKAA